MVKLESALDKIIQRQDNIKRNINQTMLQRRNTVDDSKSDFKTMLRSPTRLYTGFALSIDIQYMMRYCFSLHIRPFVTNFDQNIALTKETLRIENNAIKPNPHTHTGQIAINPKEHETNVSKIRIKIQGVDLTDAIIAEYGSFIDGYGYFPKNEEMFDVLRLLDYLAPWEQSKILSYGRKEIEISQDEDSLCECEISYVIKYNHVNRGGLY